MNYSSKMFCLSGLSWRLPLHKSKRSLLMASQSFIARLGLLNLLQSCFFMASPPPRFSIETSSLFSPLNTTFSRRIFQDSGLHKFLSTENISTVLILSRLPYSPLWMPSMSKGSRYTCLIMAHQLGSGEPTYFRYTEEILIILSGWHSKTLTA